MLNVTVVGVVPASDLGNPDTIIEPSSEVIEICSKCKSKRNEIAFAESYSFRYEEIPKIFSDQDLGFKKMGIFKRNLLLESGYKRKLINSLSIRIGDIVNIDYSQNKRVVYELENKLNQNHFQNNEERNFTKMRLYFLKTFERAEILLKQFRPETKVLFCHLDVAIAISLLRPDINFLADTPQGYNFDTLKDNLAFSRKIFGKYKLWSPSQKPFLGWGKDEKLFKLYILSPEKQTHDVQGFVSSKAGMQFFTGKLQENLTINSRYFLNGSVDPSKVLIGLQDPRLLNLCLKQKRGLIMSEDGRKQQEINFFV